MKEGPIFVAKHTANFFGQDGDAIAAIAEDAFDTAGQWTS